MWASKEAQQKGGFMKIHVGSLKVAIVVLILTLLVSASLIGCSSKEDFDGKYSGTIKTAKYEGDEDKLIVDIIVDDGYMGVDLTEKDEYEEKVTKIGTDYKYGKSGNNIYMKTDGGIFELRKIDGKYHAMLKNGKNEIVRDVIVKPKNK